MDKEQYKVQLGRMISESSYYQRTLKHIVAIIEDTNDDKKLGKKIRKFYRIKFEFVIRNFYKNY